MHRIPWESLKYCQNCSPSGFDSSDLSEPVNLLAYPTVHRICWDCCAWTVYWAIELLGCRRTAEYTIPSFFMCASMLRCSAVSDSLRPHELQPTRLLYSWNSLGKNTGVCCYSLLQGIFLTQGSKPRLIHCQADSLPLVPPGKLPSLFMLRHKPSLT